MPVFAADLLRQGLSFRYYSLLYKPGYLAQEHLRPSQSTSCVVLGVLRLQAGTATPNFVCLVEIRTQVLALAQKTLYSLIRLSSSTAMFSKYPPWVTYPV